MSEVRPPYDDEIDLFEFFETLWDGKWWILSSTFASVLAAVIYLFTADTEYEARIQYSVNVTPPSVDASVILNRFDELFYSQNTFIAWKDSVAETAVRFEDFSKTQIYNGFVFSADINDKIAVTSTESNVNYILIKSSELNILNDFFNYAQYVNATLSSAYLSEANNEASFVEQRIENLNLTESSVVGTLLQYNRFTSTVERGGNILNVQHPTLPKKTSPQSSLILALSVVLGGMVGMFFILVRNAMTKRKEQLAKA